NSLAEIIRTDHSRIEPGRLLNIKARELTSRFALPSSAVQPPKLESAALHEEHDHDHDHHDNESKPHDEQHSEETDYDHSHHHHDESVASFYVSDDRPLDLKKVEAWLTEVIRELGANIYRSKGILQIQGQAKRVVFQGVQTMFDAQPDRLWQ